MLYELLYGFGSYDYCPVGCLIGRSTSQQYDRCLGSFLSCYSPAIVNFGVKNTVL